MEIVHTSQNRDTDLEMNCNSQIKLYKEEPDDRD